MPQRFNSLFWERLDCLLQESEIVIDRPKNSHHEDYQDWVYPLDYGYLAGTTSSDGAGIDVWVGASGQKRVEAVVCTVDLVRRDSEIKLLVGCTEAEMIQVVDFLDAGDMGCYLVQRSH